MEIFIPNTEARKSLAKKLNVEYHDHMQDWEYEISDYQRINEFLTLYLKADTSVSERKSLMEIMLDCLNDMLEDGNKDVFIKFELSIIELLFKNKNEHLGSIKYWTKGHFPIAKHLIKFQNTREQHMLGRIKKIMDDRAFKSLIEFMKTIPAINPSISKGADDDGFWWVKFSIDIEHELAWNVVQELGCVVNYLSINERLPTVFYPVSPAPYMNGGPEDFLSWVIETKDKEFKPGTLKKWLEGRLPNPIDDMEQWNVN